MKLVFRAIGATLLDCLKAALVVACLAAVVLFIGSFPEIFAALIAVVVFVFLVMHYMVKIKEEDKIKAHRMKYHGEE